MIYVYHLLLTPIHFGEVYLLYVCVAVRDCYSQSTNYNYNLEKTSMYQCWYKVDVTILWGRLDVDTSIEYRCWFDHASTLERTSETLDTRIKFSNWPRFKVESNSMRYIVSTSTLMPCIDIDCRHRFGVSLC